MKIYRLENFSEYRKGWEGVYVSGLAYKIEHDLNVNITSSSDRHPTPCYDDQLKDINFYIKNYLFGFDSIEQYKNWFYTSEIRKCFGKHGAALAIYEVPKIYVTKGKRQCVFETEHGKLIKRISCIID